MGRAARANSLVQVRACQECGRDKPQADFRRIKQGCADAPDADICSSCEALWIEEGFLHPDR